MGYLSAAGQNRLDHGHLSLGEPYFFASPGVALKLYPCAVVLHAALDCLLELVKEHGIRAEDVQKVRVGMSSRSAAPLVYNRPVSGLQGKFSLPFTAAVAILDRTVGPRQFTDRKVRHPRTVALMRRVELRHDRRLDRLGDEYARAAVEIELKNGRVFKANGTVARGHPTKRPSRNELEEKFRACAAPFLRSGQMKEAVEAVWSLDRLVKLSGLLSRMIGKEF